MVDVNLVKESIEKNISGSKASVATVRGDSDHYEIKVAYLGFKDKSLVDQHKMVYDAIKEYKPGMHAVIIKTMTEMDENKQEAESFEEADELKHLIRTSISHNDVVIFMKGTPEQPLCGFSSKVVSLFNQLGIKFAGINIFDHPEMRYRLSELTEWPTIPQVFVKGNFIGGSDTTMELYESGELEKILKEANIITS